MASLLVSGIGGAGCLGGVMSGPVLAPGQGTPAGVELRAFGAVPTDDPAMPNAFGFALRQVGTDHVERAIQLGWGGALHAGDALVFGRLMFDAVAWQPRMTGGGDELSALSPTIDLGVAPLGHGLCVSTSATWEVHYGAPDRLLVGGFVGLCGGKR
jgi:hypothetical protein